MGLLNVGTHYETWNAGHTRIAEDNFGFVRCIIIFICKKSEDLKVYIDSHSIHFLDGGVRRGTDVFKALALGASDIFIGRPVVFSLAAKGVAGIRKVVPLAVLYSPRHLKVHMPRERD